MILPKFSLPKMILLAGMAYFAGWKSGQANKEGDCIVKVGGEDKRVPQAICDAISRTKSLLGGTSAGPYA